jgi:hypothetical protein
MFVLYPKTIRLDLIRFIVFHSLVELADDSALCVCTLFVLNVMIRIGGIQVRVGDNIPLIQQLVVRRGTFGQSGLPRQ